MRLFSHNFYNSVKINSSKSRRLGQRFKSVLPSDRTGQTAWTPSSREASFDTTTKVRNEDLVISWSWQHFLVFLGFCLTSLLLLRRAADVYFDTHAPTQQMSPEKLQEFFRIRPQISIGLNMLWYAAILAFLYVTIAILRNRPFWSSLGWKRFAPTASIASSPWFYCIAGGVLAVVATLVGTWMPAQEIQPLQSQFTNRMGAMFQLSMALLIAPVVEETVFRGYLYPLFAKPLGVRFSVVLTGALFGLAHGSLLGWTWGPVVTLMVVGVALTLARASTGTVLASFLLHVGYNFTLAAASLMNT